MKTKQELGQYFTTNDTLKNKVLEFVMNKPEIILEPSVGQGDLVQIIHNKNSKIRFDMYEIDKTIKMLNDIPDNVNYGDFIKETIDKKYLTIIGNPPFVRTKKGNLYIDFIEKCYNLLEVNGEMVFIIPSDFFKLTCAAKLLNRMIENGTFTHIYHPHDENLFQNACIDVLVFRYCKNSKLNNVILYNNELLYVINNDGLVTFNKKDSSDLSSFKDYFDIYVGLVSGRESVYKNKDLGNINVLNGKNKVEKYIYIEDYPCNTEEINEYLLNNKEELMNRKIRKFTEKNWYEWGAPRNISKMVLNKGKSCIYIHNLTRKDEVAFLGKVDYFGGNLLILIPKKKCNLKKIVKYLNSNSFKKNFIFSGRFKIGHRQLSNSLIFNFDY